jgi:hypothetical protein
MERAGVREEGTARIVVHTDMDGNGRVDAEEWIDLTEAKLSLAYFFGTLLDTHHKAIRVSRGALSGGLLIIDLNENGLFDHSRELFTNQFTEEKLPAPNAAVALLQYDHLQRGGNQDGLLDNRDVLWDLLYLWHDRDDDGRASREEMTSLAELGISRVNPLPRAFTAGDGNRGLQIQLIAQDGQVIKGELL